MALNPFFLQGSFGEQRLVQELINEQLKIYGVEVTYIPRKYVRKQTIIEEVQSSKFDDNFLLEAYVNTYDGYSGAGDLMTKFGVSLRDELTVTVSRERFEDFISPFLDDESDQEVEVAGRPREGDLIYFPLGKRLFEVKFVEHENPFYQLGKNYVYELKCELFEYEDEVFDTSIDAIDTVLEDQGYILDLTMFSTGSGASATASVGTGYIQKIFLDNDGSGFTSTPTVAITTAPSGGTDATAVAITTTRNNITSISEILLTNAGTGYTVAPTITISGGGGTGAAATCSIVTSFNGVNSVNISNGGSGYATVPLITFSAPTGPGAAATATVSAAGTVTDTTITNGGNFYIPSSSPTVTFSDPGDSTGILFGSWNTEFYISNSSGTVTGSNGSGYSPGTYDLSGGSGTGARLIVTQSSGSITGASGGLSFADGGRNYQVGDVLLIDGGNQNSYIRVAITTTRSNTTATGTATVGSGGTVTSITITDPGTGYNSAPTVSIGNSIANKIYNTGLTTATAVATVGSAGTVSSITLTNSGLGYTGTPTVTVGSAATTGIGTYWFNEVITGSRSGMSGRVKRWDADTNILRVGLTSGYFYAGETLTGAKSGAAYVIKNTGVANTETDKYRDNDEFETQADSLIDFSETNPFGTY